MAREWDAGGEASGLTTVSASWQSRTNPSVRQPANEDQGGDATDLNLGGSGNCFTPSGPTSPKKNLWIGMFWKTQDDWSSSAPQFEHQYHYRTS
jgi:hypothetical protein